MSYLSLSDVHTMIAVMGVKRNIISANVEFRTVKLRPGGEALLWFPMNAPDDILFGENYDGRKFYVLP